MQSMNTNFVEILTKKFNNFFRVFIFIMYYNFTLAAEAMILIIQHKESTIIGKIGAVFVGVISLTIIIILNKMSTWISTTAHHSYDKLYFLSNDKRIRMSFRQRWKLLSFIEKLSGHTIGFYCYDLFPMTSERFFQYLYVAGANYFLIMNIFQ